MAAWRDDDGLKWRALTPFGIEIDHDLSQPLTGAAAERFVALFRQGGMIVAHRQKLTMDQQTALMALFGPILRRPGESGYLTTDVAHSSSRSELTFHADAAYTDKPFDALSLHAVDVVDGASSTRFAGAERGLATMPATLRDRLQAYEVDMISPQVDGVAMRACDQRDPQARLRGRRPSVITNPHTGRNCVGVSEMHAAQLAGMDWAESRDLLHAVYDHLYAPENCYEHIWHNGDLVIWDNYTLQHARGSLESAGRRVLQRVLVGVETREHDINLNRREAAAY